MAIAEMPRDYVIKPFLEAHRVEVKGMLLTEYNEAETMELFREEGREEGRAEALSDAARKVAARFHISLEEARAVLAK